MRDDDEMAWHFAYYWHFAGRDDTPGCGAYFRDGDAEKKSI